jgi:hypothetical protein
MHTSDWSKICSEPQLGSIYRVLKADVIVSGKLGPKILSSVLSDPHCSGRRQCAVQVSAPPASGSDDILSQFDSRLRPLHALPLRIPLISYDELIAEH